MAEFLSDVTMLLAKAGGGDREGRDQLFRVVEEELRRIAQGYMRRERPDHTLQATALVDDAFMRLAGSDGKAIPWQDRAHFYRAAARAMRRILIDHERQRNRQKRGGGQYRRADVHLDELGQDQLRFDLLAMDEALDSLATFDRRQADVVELRHFGGYTVEETARILEISSTTVKDEFATAKLWLLREISRGDEDR